MTSFYVPSVSGLRAQQARLDAVANNLANWSTPGFKTARLDLADQPQQPAEVARAGEATTDPAEIGGGVALAGVTHSFAVGPLITTGNPLDLALTGPGVFFQVTTPDGQTAYTRDGRFRVDGEGVIVTGNGDRLVPAIMVPAGGQVSSVTPEGVVLGTVPGMDEPVELGRITLARFANPDGLAAIGEDRFVETVASGPALTGEPATGEFPPVRSEAIEGSNVDLAEQATAMIEAQRAYTMNVRAIQTLDEMIGLVLQTRS